MTDTFKQLRSVLEIVALTVFIAVCSVVLYKLVTDRQPTNSEASVGALSKTVSETRRDSPLPTEPVSLIGSASKGNAAARIAIMEWSEFQCPFCQRFAADTLPTIDKDYVATGRVRLVFKHLPLEQIHSFALNAAKAAECAGRQGRFWAMHDLIFLNPKMLGLNELRTHATRLDLDTNAFSVCLDGGDAKTAILQDIAQARALNVTGTPTFFFGFVQSDSQLRVTHRMSGARPIGAFREILDKLLQSARNPE